MVKDKEDKELKKIQEAKIKAAIAEQRAKGRGAGVPQTPVGPRPPAQVLSLEQVMPTIMQMKDQMQKFDQGMQRFSDSMNKQIFTTQQMVQNLARPDLALGPVIDAWTNSYSKDMLIVLVRDFKMVIIGDIAHSESKLMSTPKVSWFVIHSEQQGWMTVRQRDVYIKFEKTPEMIENDGKRKVQAEENREAAERIAEETRKRSEAEAVAAKDSKLQDLEVDKTK